MTTRARTAGPRTTGARRVLIAHPAADLYGSDRVLLETVQALDEAGWQVTVTVPAGGPLLPELRRRGAEVVLCQTPVIRKSALAPRGFLTLLGQALGGMVPAMRLLRRQYDLVLVNTVTIPAWILYGRLLRRKVVVHVHEAESTAPRLVRRAMALPLVAADRIILNSKFSLEVLTGSIARLAGRSEVVYNGVAGPPTRVAAREHIIGPARLLYIGRLSPRKGPSIAVDALAELVRRGVDARLSLLGAVFPGYEWFQEQLLATVAGSGLGDRVEFLGFQPDVWPHVQDTDVVLIPSQVDEPFGNTAVEAVLAGRPAVVSNTSGLREAAAGYDSVKFVPPSRPSALADAVEEILGCWPRIREQAARDAVLAHDRHDPARYRQDIADLADSLTGALR